MEVLCSSLEVRCSSVEVLCSSLEVCCSSLEVLCSSLEVLSSSLEVRGSSVDVRCSSVEELCSWRGESSPSFKTLSSWPDFSSSLNLVPGVLELSGSSLSSLRNTTSISAKRLLFWGSGLSSTASSDSESSCISKFSLPSSVSPMVSSSSNCSSCATFSPGTSGSNTELVSSCFSTFTFPPSLSAMVSSSSKFSSCATSFTGSSGSNSKLVSPRFSRCASPLSISATICSLPRCSSRGISRIISLSSSSLITSLSVSWIYESSFSKFVSASMSLDECICPSSNSGIPALSDVSDCDSILSIIGSISLLSIDWSMPWEVSSIRIFTSSMCCPVCLASWSLIRLSFSSCIWPSLSPTLLSSCDSITTLWRVSDCSLSSTLLSSCDSITTSWCVSDLSCCICTS